MANIRKHQLLKPEIKMLVTAIDSITPSNYTFDYLEIEGAHMQQMNLQLGFPANVVHIIRPGSPLYNLSLQVCAAACCYQDPCVVGTPAARAAATPAGCGRTFLRWRRAWDGLHAAGLKVAANSTCT